MSPRQTAPVPAATASAKISALKAGPARVSFKAQMLQAREEAIVQAASRLLAE